MVPWQMTSYDQTFTSILCSRDMSMFEFNLDKTGLTGEILINDFLTKRQYKVLFPSGDPVCSWYNLLCVSSKCFSYYRSNTDDSKITLVVMNSIEEQMRRMKNEGNSIHLIKVDHAYNDARSYYLSNGTQYTGSVKELECVLLDEYDVMNVDVENIHNKFELRSIIYQLRSYNEKLKKKTNLNQRIVFVDGNMGGEDHGNKNEHQDEGQYNEDPRYCLVSGLTQNVEEPCPEDDIDDFK